MRQFFWSTGAVVCMVVLLQSAQCRSIVKRSANPEIDPIHVHDEHDGYHAHDKRKIEVVTGVKNAVLGFVFNKINSFIDQKTHWVAQLDHQNIAKNKAAGIEPPKDPVTSLSGIISGVIGQKLQAAGPLLTIVTNKLGSGSGSGGHGSGGAGLNFGAFLGAGAHKK